MLCILPFEEAFYLERGVEARYVGNPVLDELREVPPRSALRAQLGARVHGTSLALLPGSRRGEILRIFPTMLEAARLLQRERPGLSVVVPVAPTLPHALLEELANRAHVRPTWVEGRAPEVAAACDAAVVASGTAVLEAALMGTPLVVVYRLAPVTWAIANAMVKLEYVSLVNLLAKRRVVPELLQGAMTAEGIATEVRRLLDDPQARTAQESGIRDVRSALGEPGASRRAADEVMKVLAVPRS
jgi:lipid-A-disaccharide synthase